MLKDLASSHNTKFLLVSFSDLFGVMRSKLVPVAAIDLLEKNGASFAGFATHFDRAPGDPDLTVRPDPNTFTVLPWHREVAWVTGDVYASGALFEQSPRNLLKSRMERERKRGLLLKTGVEAEFFLLSSQGLGIHDDRDRYPKPCYDQSALMRSYPVIGEISEALDELGWRPYQNDHEDANGQFEINWDFADALTTADRHAFFKFAVKSIAEKRGLKASFMPKPFETLTGNGCHVHCSLWKQDRNLFPSPASETEFAATGRHFVAGLLENAPALCALTNPTVNSYRRLNARGTSSGATWVTQKLCWGGDNRDVLVRVPDTNRCELRIPDGSADPYLLQHAVLVAGMDGIAAELTPGDQKQIYRSKRFGVDQLPPNLFDALEFLQADAALAEALGERMTRGLANLRRRQLQDYMQSVSPWELATTLDC
jgi:glutamine synthetase type III